MDTRPFPINATVVIRSALFALAQIGARIEQYKEPEGVIIATLDDKRIKIGALKVGNIQHKITATVRENEGTAILELDAPDRINNQILDLISRYAIEGSKAVTEDAVKQWHELIEQLREQREKEEKKRQLKEKTQRIIEKITTPIKNLFGSKDNSEVSDKNKELANDTEANFQNDAPIVIIDSNSRAITVIPPQNTKALELKIPDNPGILVRNADDKVFELKPDSVTFTDRTAFLQKCEVDSAFYLKGSKYCPNCGRPLTLGVAYRSEVQKKIIASANLCIRYGLTGLVPSIVLSLFLFAPTFVLMIWSILGDIRFLLGKNTMAGAVLVILFFVSLPSITLGKNAISEGQKATQYLSLNFNFDNKGRKRVGIGQALGWLDVYLGFGVLVFVVVSAFITTR